jgi:hypothetical protein
LVRIDGSDLLAVTTPALLFAACLHEKIYHDFMHT